jgi:hypothetical protein
MTVTIEIPADLEAELEAEASRRGLSKDDFARIILEEKLRRKGSAHSEESSFKPRIIATSLPVKDRSREYEWLKEHRDQYAGLYVALSGDCLLSQGKTFKEAATAARKAGVTDALIVFVEGSDTPPYVGL